MKTNQNLFRILIVEDEILIARAIEQLANWHFVCETHIALSVNEARIKANRILPHLILCDVNLKDDITGIDFIRTLQDVLNFETIFITANSSKVIIEEALLSTPSNFIIKPFNDTQLVAALKIAQNKLAAMPQAGTLKLQIKDVLTKAECKVLQLISDNKTTSEIADALFISPNTVKNHRHNISRKLDLSTDNNALIKWAIENKPLLVSG
jgi:DNA-binding NarL/FixJ family response regulator